MWWETTVKPQWEWGTWASCSLDHLQHGYRTPSPPHQWTHHIDGERLHQSNTMLQGTQASTPLGKTLETVLKPNIISTNKPRVRAHFQCRNKKKYLQTPCWNQWAHLPMLNPFKQLGTLWRRKIKHPERVGMKRKRERKKPKNKQVLIYFWQATVHWNKIICVDPTNGWWGDNSDKQRLQIQPPGLSAVVKGGQLMRQYVESFNIWRKCQI